MKKSSLLSVVFCFFLSSLCSTQIYAQKNTSPMKGIQVIYKPVSNSTQFRTEVKITLLQTDGIAKINLRIGSSRNSNDLYSHSFTFDESAGTLSDGSTYSRNGNVVTLTLPNMDKQDHFFGDVSIERTDASTSDPITFNR